MAMEIRSVKADLMQVVDKVNDCLLFIDETKYYIAWYKNTAY